MATSDPVPQPPAEPLPPTEAITATPALPAHGVATGPAPAPPGYPYPYPPPAPPKPPHPGFWWSVLWCVLFVLCTQVPGALVGALALVVLYFVAPRMFPPDLGNGLDALFQSEGGKLSMAVAMFATEILVIFFSWFIIRLIIGRDWKRQLAVRGFTLPHLVLIWLAFPATVVLSNAIYALLQKLLPSIFDKLASGVDVNKMVEMFQTWPWGFAVLVIGFGPGIGEELWCRGFLGRGLVGRHGYVVGVILASFFFGLIHVDPAQGTMAMLMGLWLHLVYLTTRSLLAPILLHAMNNSLAVVASRIPGMDQWEKATSASPLLVVLTAANLVAAVGWALYQTRARLVDVDPTEPSWRPAWPGVECPPPTSGTRIVTPQPAGSTWILVLMSFLAFATASALSLLR